MPDNPNQTSAETIGAFTVGVARIVKHGAATIDASGSASSLSDEYAVVMPDAETRATPENVSGLPKIDDEHPVHDGLKCSGLDFQSRGDGSRVWDISAKYERAAKDEDEEEPGDEGNITALEWGTVSHQADLVCDAVSGKPLLNSAGDPYADAIQTETCDLQIRFTRKEKRADLSKLALSGTVNSGAISILGASFAKHKARIEIHIKDTLDTTEGALRYEYDYTITARTCIVRDLSGNGGNGENGGNAGSGSGGGSGSQAKDVGWDVPVLESGFQYLGEEGEKVKFLVADGKGGMAEPSLPQLLDAEGKPLADGKRAVVTTYAQFPEGNWSVLHLPKRVPSKTKAAET